MDSVCIFIFRRDYRLYDNTTLLEVCKTHKIVIPIFIFTTKQLDSKQNVYRSDKCVQFMCNSLQDLYKQLGSNLYFFYGDEYIILDSLIKLIPNLKTIAFNKDYTKYSKDRDMKINLMCIKNKINCVNLDDICLNLLGSVLTTTGKVYTKFTPFFNASQSKIIRKPISNNFDNYLSNKTELGKSIKKLKYSYSIDEMMKPNGKVLGEYVKLEGGRTNGLDILKNIIEWKDYNDKRNILTYKTTHLSAYNKFGCVSIREVYWLMIEKLGKNNELIKQLFWRDFFYNLSDKFPEIYEYSLNPKYRNIKWKYSKDKFNAWCQGNTGFPIIDACMRELNSTGYMHNRGRLIVSNFLCRLMHIDWRLGELYFAQHLIDYDPAQNNFGWQVSGANTSGTTSRPLEQTILNPWLQSSQFDNDGEYIKKWCPELNDVRSTDLHKWDIACEKWLKEGVIYRKPILEYKTEKIVNLRIYLHKK